MVDFSLVQTIKLQLHISFVIFPCQLTIKQILPLCILPPDSILRIKHGEFPVDDCTFMLVPHQQIISFELLFGHFSHPLLHRHSLVVIFQHLLTYDLVHCVYNLEQIVNKFVFTLELLNCANISAFSRSLDI